VQIAVAGGKGGAGKTTVALGLVFSLPDVVLLDCDVDEPNCALFLDREPEPLTVVSKTIPRINADQCTLCGECVKLCQFNALLELPAKILVREEFCHSCGLCSRACPQEAIAEEKKRLGLVKSGRGEVEFYQGELTVGQARSSPVVKAVKEQVQAGAVNVIDAPPGCSCAVLTALTGADYCILVTNPTPFGLSDLEKFLDIVENLGIPYGVIINQSESEADARIEQFCTDRGVSVLAKIPYSEEIAQNYSRGVSIVEGQPEYRQQFRQIYSEIQTVTEGKK